MPETATATTRCPGCGTEVTAALLACPACQRLVHAESLKSYAAEAERAEATGDLTAAVSNWRAALELLPAGSRQHAGVTERIAGLSRRIEGATPGANGAGKQGVPKVLAGLGALGLLLWKFKFLAVFVLTKGKLLLLGLTKASTVFSMLLSFGVYWTAWGWKFAAGLIVGIYIHEMGHVAALRRFGIPASAPMFIPGFGALVRLRQNPASLREDARVGLAGPLWGLGATVLAWGLAKATGAPSLLAIAHTSAWINLFNLLPIGSLDGGRGFRALSRGQRGWATAAIAAAWFMSGESLLVLLLIAAGFRAMSREAPAEPDRGALLTYSALVGALALFVWMSAPLRGG